MIFQKIRTTFVLLVLMVFGLNAEAAFLDTQGHRWDFKNKWVILNFWADWCESCIAEVPELNHFYQDNLNKNVVMVGVNYDQLPLTPLKSAVNKVGIEFPVLTADPGLVGSLNNIDIIPVTFIIDPNGKVASKIVGPSSEDSLKQELCAKSANFCA